MREKIIQAQREILDSLVACEAKIGELYELYAVLFPQNKSLWSSLAQEERSHSTALASLTKWLDAGSVFWGIGQFREDFIGRQYALAQAALEQARAGGLTEADAVAAATRIEMSLLESTFYTTVKSEAKDFSDVADTLAKATTVHIQRLRTHITERAVRK